MTRGVNAAQDAWRDSKSPPRPRDVTAFRPAFAPHSLRRLRHSSAFATALRDMALRCAGGALHIPLYLARRGG
jgi:hypothetical protein